MKRSLRGFSLIEIMVAMVLMAMMGVLLMVSINSSISARDKVEEISDRYQMVRQALTRMSREISMAYLSKHINIIDPAYITQFKGRKDSLYFSAFGNVVRQKDAKESDQQVLGYYLDTNSEGHKSLMRKFQANLNLDVEKGGRAQVLCPNISKLEFLYYDDQLNKWDEEWIADPTNMVAEGLLSGQQANKNQKQWRLPSYVKITLTAEMEEGVEMKWISETQIPMKDPIDFN
jgi:general secretion pathway protein J